MGGSGGRIAFRRSVRMAATQHAVNETFVSKAASRAPRPETCGARAKYAAKTAEIPANWAGFRCESSDGPARSRAREPAAETGASAARIRGRHTCSRSRCCCGDFSRSPCEQPAQKLGSPATDAGLHGEHGATINGPVRGFRGHDRSSEPAGQGFRCDAGRPRRRPSRDSSRASVRRPRASGSSRTGEGGGEAHHASSDEDGLALGVVRHPPQRVVTPILKDERDGLPQAVQALFSRPALAVCAWNLGAVGDEPLPVPLDDRREFVSHLARRAKVPCPWMVFRQT